MNVCEELKKYENDYNEVKNLFFPYFEAQNEPKISIFFENNEKMFNLTVEFDDSSVSFSHQFLTKEHDVEIKKYSKIFFYDTLHHFTGKSFEWGSLTGVRPTKIAYKLLENGTPELFLKEALMKEYRLSENKANLLKETIKNQKCIIKNDNLVDIYVNIPICPSRCKYCSFISAEIESVRNIVPKYIECLKKEIFSIREIIRNKSLIVRSVYIGGGTPSVLTADELDEILSELNFNVNEFTVECGRPDTITREKLEVLKRHNVTRICINPQTFVNKTLKLIGRKHTVKDVLDAYALALEFGFDVNLDLIAGLEDESFANFKKSINYALEMAPQNITIHTLSLKRGSNLTNEALKNLKKNEVLPQNEIILHENEVKKMIDYGHKRLFEEGYRPYYLYRQKNTPLGLENVGFAIKGKVCIFNVDSMEETCSVLGVGANAVSKRVFNLENRIERSANVKFIQDYIDRIDEMIERKRELFK